MTEPLISEETPAVAAAVTAVQAVVDNAKSLGLTWTLRPATVATDSADPNEVPVIFDGDTAVVSTVSLIGAFSANARVMVMMVPPGGLFIVGWVGTGPRLDEVTVANDTQTSLTTSIVTLSTTEIEVEVAEGDAYKVTAFFDFNATGSGYGVAVGYLEVDGAQVDGQALFSAGVARATVGQQWSGTLTAGAHTFALAVQKTINAGTIFAMNLHTTMSVEIRSAGLSI